MEPTLTKSCSCDRTHIVFRNVGYHVSCLSSEGSWKNWLTLSFSLISSPPSGFLAAKTPNSMSTILNNHEHKNESLRTHRRVCQGKPDPLPLEHNTESRSESHSAL